ncbi:hypothetical protein V8E36_001429 [Tilletia maclaganii]
MRAGRTLTHQQHILVDKHRALSARPRSRPRSSTPRRAAVDHGVAFFSRLSVWRFRLRIHPPPPPSAPLPPFGLSQLINIPTPPQSTQGPAPPPASQARDQIRRHFDHDFASQDTLAPAGANPFSADVAHDRSPPRARGASTRPSDVRASPYPSGRRVSSAAPARYQAQPGHGPPAPQEIAAAPNPLDQQASLDRSQQRSPPAHGGDRFAAAASLTRLSGGVSHSEPLPPATTPSTTAFVAEGAGPSSAPSVPSDVHALTPVHRDWTARTELHNTDAHSYRVSTTERRRSGQNPAVSITERHIAVLGLEAITSIQAKSCDEHIAAVLIRVGVFPATPRRPQTAFTFSMLRLFRSLQDETRIGTSHFTNALLTLYQLGTSKMKPDPAIPSKFRVAFGWYRALERRCRDTTLKPKTATTSGRSAFVRPTLDVDNLQLRVEDLAARCPACFGGLSTAIPVTEITDGAPESVVTADTKDGPQVIVCLDGNFQHKRWRKDDAVANSQAASGLDGPTTGCGAYVKAAVEGLQKGSLGAFDITGVIGMTCRHGAPLLITDVVDSGESHYYAYALIKALLITCGPQLTHLGVCYDIGCKLAVSPRIIASLDSHFPSTAISYTVSLFHVYGHDTDCQTKYSPRRCPGFGWTDGESLERLWSSLRHLVSISRPMSRVNRQHTLTIRLQKLARDNRLSLASRLRERLVKVSGLMREEVTQFVSQAGKVKNAVKDLEVEGTMRCAELATSGNAPTDTNTPSGSGSAQVVSSGASLTSLPAKVGIPASLSDLQTLLNKLIKSRRDIAFGRKQVRDKALKRLANLIDNPVADAEDPETTDERAGRDRSAADSSTRASRARQKALLGPANALKFLANREKTACEALSAAALDLYNPLVKWHGISDQMKSRSMLPSNDVLIRQTASKSNLTASVNAAFKAYNDTVDNHTRIVEECETIKQTVMAKRPERPVADGFSFVALAMENGLGGLHYGPAGAGSAGVGLSRAGLASRAQEANFANLEAYRLVPVTPKLDRSKVFERDLLDRLAALVNPADLRYQPWAMSPVLANSMDKLERIHRLNEEIYRLAKEVGDAVGWLASCSDRLSSVQDAEKDPDRLALVQRYRKRALCLVAWWEPDITEFMALLSSTIDGDAGQTEARRTMERLMAASRVARPQSDGRRKGGNLLETTGRRSGIEAPEVVKDLNEQQYDDEEELGVPSDHGSSVAGGGRGEGEDEEGDDAGEVADELPGGEADVMSGGGAGPGGLNDGEAVDLMRADVIRPGVATASPSVHVSGTIALGRGLEGQTISERTSTALQGGGLGAVLQGRGEGGGGELDSNGPGTRVGSMREGDGDRDGLGRLDTSALSRAAVSEPEVAGQVGSASSRTADAAEVRRREAVRARREEAALARWERIMAPANPVTFYGGSTWRDPRWETEYGHQTDTATLGIISGTSLNAHHHDGRQKHSQEFLRLLPETDNSDLLLSQASEGTNGLRGWIRMASEDWRVVPASLRLSLSQQALLACLSGSCQNARKTLTAWWPCRQVKSSISATASAYQILFHVIRINKMLSCAGADRLQAGMRGAWGKPYDTVVRVDIGQILMSVRCRDSNRAVVLEALRRARYKLAGRQKPLNTPTPASATRRSTTRLPAELPALPPACPHACPPSGLSGCSIPPCPLTCLPTSCPPTAYRPPPKRPTACLLSARSPVCLTTSCSPFFSDTPTASRPTAGAGPWHTHLGTLMPRSRPSAKRSR